MEKRQLKFRVWNGMEMIYDVTVGRFGVFYVNPGSKGDGLDEKDSASLTPFTTKYSDETPVMQSTGLKDRNGVEIYEGDIVNFALKETRCSCNSDSKFSSIDKFCPSCGRELKAEDFITKSVIEYKNAGFYLAYRKKEYDMMWGYYAAENFIQWMEVIGNIYSNPELLK